MAHLSQLHHCRRVIVSHRGALLSLNTGPLLPCAGRDLNTAIETMFPSLDPFVIRTVVRHGQG